MCASTSALELTVSWINEVEMAELKYDLMTSQSIKAEYIPEFEILDAGIASALRKNRLQYLIHKKSQC